MEYEKYNANVKRPDMKPFYINDKCDICGETLVPVDLIYNRDTDEEEIWWDEWACPECHEEHGIYLDWPEEAKDKILNVSLEDCVPWEEVNKELQEDNSNKETPYKEVTYHYEYR